MVGRDDLLIGNDPQFQKDQSKCKDLDHAELVISTGRIFIKRLRHREAHLVKHGQWQSPEQKGLQKGKY